MFVFKIFVHVCQIMQEIKDPRLGHSPYFFLFEVIAVGAKKKKRTKIYKRWLWRHALSN